ncbi:MAG: hypothetical protein VSS75_016750 [Candidatus Parabeggiatoa sp.]|nr:hypothetical protein [Candidatus Parabeggiatoa sp.]
MLRFSPVSRLNQNARLWFVETRGIASPMLASKSKREALIERREASRLYIIKNARFW